MQLAPTPAGVAPWWQGAVVAFADIGRRWLKARFPNLRSQHDDLLGEAVLQLTGQLMTEAAQWPPSWFEPSTPPDGDIRRFHGLAFTVLNCRVQDEFRKEYRDWMESLDEVPEEDHPADSAPDAATALSHVRAVRALIEAMHAMTLRDRMLVERVAMGDKSTPMTGAERERVRTLRVGLRRQLQKILGENPPPNVDGS